MLVGVSKIFIKLYYIFKKYTHTHVLIQKVKLQKLKFSQKMFYLSVGQRRKNGVLGVKTVFLF